MALDKENNKNELVIDVVNVKIKSSVSIDAFKSILTKISDHLISTHEGFVSREIASSKEGEFLVITRWLNENFADASMVKFMNNSVYHHFEDNVDLSTLVTQRYFH